jgi:hypothetical protein
MTHLVQIDDLVREATSDETAVIDASQATAAAELDKLQAAAAARASGLAKLADLGLTEAEIKALVG